MLERFYPDERVASVYVIDFRSLYEQGCRGLIFDIDNTLVPHGKPADRRAVELFRELKEIGFSCILLSNNNKKRVEPFARELGVPFLSLAMKPSRKGYIKAMEMMGTSIDNTVFIGDQLFTDVWGAVRIGMRNILTDPINPREEIQIVFKRWLEKLVLERWEREKCPREKNS